MILYLDNFDNDFHIYEKKFNIRENDLNDRINILELEVKKI
jgi:hypothetical protein